MHKLRAFIPAAILAAGCALVWDPRAQNAMPLSRPISGVLANMPGYSLINQVLSEDERRVAGMTNYIARVYLKGDAVEFTTLVAYYDSQASGKTIHSPKNCLPGAGWEITTVGVRKFVERGEDVIVNRYVIRSGRATAITYYWYQGRGRITANEYVVKWNLLRDAALKGRTEESLVRLIVPLTAQRSEIDADRLADVIVPRLIADVASILPQGDASLRVASASR